MKVVKNLCQWITVSARFDCMVFNKNHRPPESATISNARTPNPWIVLAIPPECASGSRKLVNVFISCLIPLKSSPTHEK
uniref:Uncharacterized protein n=1 Tax=Yersinia enterocolitica TaxID=630 RepID=B0RL53_YEREN|nr:hypothetical protein [Yersinia enterocolitica]